MVALVNVASFRARVDLALSDPKLSDTVRDVANATTNLAWSAFIPGNGASWTSDKIPGVGRCIAAMVRLSEQVLSDPMQEFQQALAAEPKTAQKRKEAVSEAVALRIDKEMYRDLYRKRRALWNLVDQKQLADGIVLASNSRHFATTSLEDALKGQNKSVDAFLCRAYPGVHENILAVDKVMLNSMMQIGSQRLGKCTKKHECNIDKVYNDEFVKFKESLVQASIGRGVKAGNAGRHAAVAEHQIEEMLGDTGTAIKNWLTSPPGQLFVATGFLAKSIVQPMFQGFSGLYGACDILHRISDFSSAVQSGSSALGDTWISSGPCKKAKDELDKQAAIPVPDPVA